MTKLTKKQWELAQLERKAGRIKEYAPNKNIFSDIIPFIFQMQRYERQLQRLAEHSCNGYPMSKSEYRDGKLFVFDVEDVKWRERCEKREEVITKNVIELAKEYNLIPDFQGDPRGLMFSLKDKDGKEVA